MKQNVATDKRSFSQEGFMLADAILMKTGKLPYTKEELNMPGNPEDLFYVNKSRKVVQDALNSFMGAPITWEHPETGNKLLDSEDARFHVVGAVASKPTLDREGNVRATIRVFDKQAIESIQNGSGELSPGFAFEWGNKTNAGGEVGKMAINHVAIVQKGRAGPSVRVLDHLPENLEVLKMDKTPNETEANPNVEDFVNQMKTAFDSALTQKTSESNDFEQVKTDVIAAVTAKMQPALDAMIGFTRAQEKAKADAEAAKAIEDQKTATDAAVKEAVEADRAMRALVDEAIQVNDSLKREDLDGMDKRQILTKAIGDSFTINDSMTDDMLHGMLKGFISFKPAASAAGGSIMPPPPTNPVPVTDSSPQNKVEPGTVNLDKYNKRFDAFGGK